MNRTRRISRALAAAALLSGCTRANPARANALTEPGALRLADDAPERLITLDQNQRPDSAALDLPGHQFDRDDEAKSDTLPTLPAGMTLSMIAAGDSVFHARGGCLNCHGANGEGLPARGKPVNRALAYLPANNWRAIDSLVHVGIPEVLTRSPLAMPARGQHSSLTSAEMDEVAAYVWAISQTKGEPWPGGHLTHVVHDWRASSRTSIP